MALNHPAQRCAILVIASCLALALIIPPVPAADPGDRERMHALVTVPDLNVTNGSFANRTVPDRYQKGPDPLDIRVELDEPLVSAPKGEMALGPRTIGISASPVFLATLFIAACAVGMGAWYVMKRKRDNEKEE